MKYYDQEILKGLIKVPTPNFPGSLVVTGEAQAVLTGEKPGEIIIAAFCYKKGRVLVTAHDCYLNWLSDDHSSLKKKFNTNIKIWLTGEDILSSEIVNFQDASKSKTPFGEYKMMKWHHDFHHSEEDEERLLDWLAIGGGLICGTTPWGYLQIYQTNDLNEMSMHRFLKNQCGILLTSEVLHFPDEIIVSNNRAKHSHFEYALTKVTLNPEKLNKYSSTIECALDHLNNEGLLDNEKIIELKRKVFKRELIKIPKENNPIKISSEKTMVNLLGKCISCVEGEKAPGVEEFPGDFNKLPELLENVQIEIKANFEEWVSSGYYLPAGICMNVEIDSEEIDGWSIRIGAHSDNISSCDIYKRWPCISLTKILSNKMSFSSPFGGLIYFQSSAPGSLKARLTNVVESPYFDLTKQDTVKNWINRKFAPGLWAELAGEHIIFTTPSSCIRHIEDPSEVIKFWDKVVRTHHECRGTNPKHYKRERVVNDRQPSAGYMHSGYPIVTHLDCCQKDHNECIFDLEKLMKNGNWGLFHELGHNMQRNEWTFEGSVEVTVNIFSLHATYKLIGQDVLDQKWPRNQMASFKNFFEKQPSKKDYQSQVGMALMLFIQLIKHFGWPAMYKFMKNYEADIESGKNLPKSDQEKIDQWVIRYSKIVSKNLIPQFQMFGLDVSEKVKNELKGLSPWSKIEEKDAEIFFKKLNF